MKRRSPWRVRSSIKMSRNGRPRIVAMGFGRSSTRLRSRLPSPPARITASTTRWSDIELPSLRSVVIVFGEIDDLRAQMVEPDGNIQQRPEPFTQERLPLWLDDEHHESARTRAEQLAP